MTTAFIIRAIAFANGAPCPHEGEWIESFDHDAHGGRGHGTFTANVNDAKRFATRVDALTFWHRQSIVRPHRPDGEPNRPLTALSVQIEPLP